MRQLSLRKKILIKTLYFTAISLCIVLSWIIFKKDRDVSLNSSEPDYSIARQIKYGFTLKNTTNRLLKHAEFWTYAPVKQTSTQKCIHLGISHPYQLILDDWNNQILHFTFKNLPPYAHRVVTIKADLMLADMPNPVQNNNLDDYLSAEKYIECNNPLIKAQSQSLKAQSPIQTSENIYHWVTSHTTYSGFSRNDRGALYAFKSKKGDCTEFMYLFAALCRANQIPARCMGGYICRRNQILKPGGYHNWAEIYENGTWQPVDPLNRVFKENPSQFVAMHLLGESENNPMENHHRFRFEGAGLKVWMNG